MAHGCDELTPGNARACYQIIKMLEKQGRSISEAFTKFGYNLKLVVEPTRDERNRIVNELLNRPSNKVKSDLLDVEQIKADHEIPEHED